MLVSLSIYILLNIILSTYDVDVCGSHYSILLNISNDNKNKKGHKTKI